MHNSTVKMGVKICREKMLFRRWGGRFTVHHFWLLPCLCYKPPCMKIRVAVLAILLIGSISSCKKDTLPVDDLQGQWELRSVMAEQPSIYQPGNGRIVRFSGKQYEFRENGQVTRSGSFKLVKDGSVAESTCLVSLPAGSFQRRIIFDNDVNADKTFVQVDGTQLQLISGCFAFDAGSQRWYEKL